MGLLNQILGLLLSLSILIFLHELGHFFFARLFKTRVEKFYLFFNPWFSLVRAKRINGRWRFSCFSKSAPEEWKEHPDSTEWGLGWIPLGGYCSIAGMIDETKSADNLGSEPQPWEYRSKKTWQRLLIISGGVLTNFVLALIIYSGILFIWGTETLPLKNATLGYSYDKVLLINGFQNGDMILKIDGKDIHEMEDVIDGLVVKKAKTVTLDRQGQIMDVQLSDSFREQLLANNVKVLMVPRFPFVIGQFVAGSPAEKAGMRVGDSIISLNDSLTATFDDFAERIESYKAQNITVQYSRNGEPMSISFRTTDDGKIGAYPTHPYKIFKTKITKYGFFESIPAGVSFGVETLGRYVSSLKLVFTKEGAKQVGGFGSIGSLFPKEWDWERFWNLTALLSIVLAFMNILPIPALDGGHVMFTLVEMITGRKPSDKFLERAQTVGMLLLLALLVFANGNDILKLFR